MPFYDPSAWELVKEIQSKKEDILKEFNQCVERRLVKEKFNATTSFETKLYKGYVGFLGITMDTMLWSPEEKSVYSEELQEQFNQNRKECPIASDIISKYPYIRQFFWNTLPGGGEIRPHYGVNGKIWGRTPDHARVQFCWEPGEECYFYLQNECVKYREDLVFGFHDGMDLHWVKNRGDKLRSVLILDLWESQCEDIHWGNLETIKGKFTF